MGNERADFAAVSALIATNIDMAGYPAQNDCFATVNKMSVILYNILDNIYFELKSTYSFQAWHGVWKNNKILLFTTANERECKWNSM